MSNTAEEKTNLVLKVLRYAQEHNLDIKNLDAVKRILQAIHYSFDNDSEIRELMVLLKTTDNFMDLKAEEQSKVKLKN